MVNRWNERESLFCFVCNTQACAAHVQEREVGVPTSKTTAFGCVHVITPQGHDYSTNHDFHMQAWMWKLERSSRKKQEEER